MEELQLNLCTAFVRHCYSYIAGGDRKRRQWRNHIYMKLEGAELKVTLSLGYGASLGSEERRGYWLIWLQAFRVVHSLMTNKVQKSGDGGSDSERPE